ncbi:MAG: hypothetical protein DMD92_20610, partial [Candidatus Rokuibacteriota bacterium]
MAHARRLRGPCPRGADGGTRPRARDPRAQRRRRLPKLRASKTSSAAPATIVAPFSCTAARWARANAPSSWARRAASARGSTTVS